MSTPSHDPPPRRGDDPGSGLELDGLSKSYGSVHALSDLSFAVAPGEIFGFVGSNGAGKTTAMRIMLGVLAADRGEVRWQGRPLDLASRRRVGYMPEERGLYPRMKVGTQLTYLAQLHGMSADEAGAAVRRWTERLGVDGRAGDEVQALSLGNQQRVQLAAALVHEPALLVLDEPFSGLDPVAVDVMSSVLQEKADDGVPVVFSSHQLELVERLCDRVGIIRGGELVAIGTIEELRRTDKPRYAIGAEHDVLADAPQWAAAVPGAEVTSTERARVVIELPDADADEQALLQAALRSGRVREFAPVQPSLAELFRGVVTSDPGGEPAPEGNEEEAA